MRPVVRVFTCIFGVIYLIHASRPAVQEEPTPQGISISISTSPGRPPPHNYATSEGISEAKPEVNSASQGQPSSQQEGSASSQKGIASSQQEGSASSQEGSASSQPEGSASSQRDSPASQKGVPLHNTNGLTGSINEDGKAPSESPTSRHELQTQHALPVQLSSEKKTAPQKEAPLHDTIALTSSIHARNIPPSESQHYITIGEGVHVGFFTVFIGAVAASVPSLLFIAVFWYTAKKEPVPLAQVELETHTSPSPADQQVAASTPNTTRNAHLDNAKFILMVTILWTHAVDLDIRPWSPYVKQFVYFNTTGFAFISGLVASSSKSLLTVANVSKVCFSLGIPLVMYLVVLEPIMSSFNPIHPLAHNFQAYISRCHQNLRGDNGPTWYLHSLFYWKIWNLFMPQWTPRVKLALAVVISQLGGPIGHLGDCHIPTAMMYFPAFVLGTEFPLDETISSLTEMHYDVRSFAMAYLLASCYIEAVNIDAFSSLARWPWSTFDLLPLLFQHARNNLEFLFFGIWNLPKVLAFIYLCPHKECFITKWGKYTLYPYVLHQVLLANEHYIRQKIFPSSTINQQGMFSFTFYSYTLMLCFAGTAFLSSWPIRAIFGCMIEPITWHAMIKEWRKGKDDDSIRKA